MALHSTDTTTSRGIVFVNNLVIPAGQYILCVLGELDTCETAFFTAEFLDELGGLTGVNIVAEIPEFCAAFTRGADEEIATQLDGVDGTEVAGE